MTEEAGVSKGNPKILKKYLKNEILKDSHKLKGSFPPISERDGKVEKILKIKKIYSLSGSYQNLFMIKLHDLSDKPKTNYFFAIRLASQSSDLLVALARDLIQDKTKIKLIQFPLYPSNLRITLLALKKYEVLDDPIPNLSELKALKTEFRKRLVQFKKFLANQ